MSKWYKVIPVDLAGDAITIVGGALVVTGVGGGGVPIIGQITGLAGGPVVVSFVDEELRLDVASSTITYLGTAAVPSANSAAVWKIKRLTSTPAGSLTIEYANGDAAYTHVWNNRASFSYS